MPDGTAALAAVILSLALVGLVRRTALRHAVLDHPTERSSHSVPTPRGGGLGLIASCVIVILAAGELAGDPLGLLCLAGLVAVAGVGWLDDRHTLGIRPRLAVHAVAACFVGLVGAREAASPGLMVLLAAWWVFWTVSSINVINFMDGINGLVGSQVLVFAASLGFLLQRQGASPVLAWTLAGACAGFLPWNFPRGRIFLGDVGSGALGYAVAWLGAMAVRAHGIDPVRVYLPLAPLFADATVTMFSRWRDGERITAPHRRHLYQRLANGGMGHTRVTVLYAAAAVVGAFVAHRPEGATRTWWIVAFVISVVVASRLLERRAQSAR